MVNHAMPEASLVFLNRPVPMFEQVKVVAGLAAGVLVLNGRSDLVKLGLCLFIPGCQGLVALFVFGLVLRNMVVLVNAALNLFGEKVDLKSQVILFFFKGTGIEGRVPK